MAKAITINRPEGLADFGYSEQAACIGSSTEAHSAVQDAGMPPGGHSTPAVQQAAVTA